MSQAPLLFAPYFPVSIRLFYVSALCTGSHTYHKSSSCETISHADGANPYYDQCRSGITYLEDSLLPPCFVYSDCQAIAQFSSIINLSNNIVVHVMFVLFAVFAFVVYAVFFSVMGYIRSKQEEQRISERMLENYRNQAENNEHILEIHHEIRHHMNALSSYLNQEDYAGARQYIQKFTEEAEELPFVTYTANALVNSILSRIRRTCQPL